MSNKAIFWCSCHELDKPNRELMIDDTLNMLAPTDPMPIAKYNYSQNPPVYLTDYLHLFDGSRRIIRDIDPDANGYYNTALIHSWIDAHLGI